MGNCTCNTNNISLKPIDVDIRDLKYQVRIPQTAINCYDKQLDAWTPDKFLEAIDTTDYNELISEVLSRFNKNPPLYQKQDFSRLIQLVLKSTQEVLDSFDRITDDEINALFI